MGQQQLLLIILGVIIVGIAIAVGLQLFQAGSIGANSDAVQNDIMNIAAHADQHRIRPAAMGGGAGAFDDSNGGNIYQLPERLRLTGNGEYSIQAPGPTSITIVGRSVPYDPSSWELLYTPGAETEAERYVWTPSGDFDVAG
jgi:hypothetical protein